MCFKTDFLKILHNLAEIQELQILREITNTNARKVKRWVELRKI